MNHDVGMIIFIGKEQGYSGRSCQCIVVGELTKREESGPVVLLIVAKYPEVLFKSLVKSFGLSISFWAITQSEVNLHVQGLT